MNVVSYPFYDSGNGRLLRQYWDFGEPVPLPVLADDALYQIRANLFFSEFALNMVRDRVFRTLPRTFLLKSLDYVSKQNRLMRILAGTPTIPTVNLSSTSLAIDPTNCNFPITLASTVPCPYSSSLESLRP